MSAWQWGDCCGGRNIAKLYEHKGSIEQASVSGKQCGIGVIFHCVVTKTNGNEKNLVIDSMVPGGPAWESARMGGLQVGDVLEKIDGKNVRGVPLADLAPALLGQEGSTVTLGIRRNVVVQNFETQQRCRSVKIIRKSFSPPKELGTPNSGTSRNSSLGKENIPGPHLWADNGVRHLGHA